MTGLWGAELWDRAEVVVARSLAEAEDLGSMLPRFLKDRGEVEREYARALRKLVTKYLVKKEGKETTQSQGFRWAGEEQG